jgi:predicted dehydrogenase
VVGIAVVGVGHWGPNVVRNFAHVEGCTVRWVCDIDDARAREVAAAFGGNPTTNLSEILDDPGVHAVAIATPPLTHGVIARACLDADRHVFVEKPLTTTRVEAETLAEVAALRGRVLMCDHTYCFGPVAQVLRALVRDGELGPIRRIESTRLNRGEPRPGVDVFWDLAHHDLTILDQVLLPEVRPIAAAAAPDDPSAVGGPTSGVVTLQFEGGAAARLHVDWMAPRKVRTMRFEGSQQSACWDDLAASPLQLSSGVVPPFDRAAEPLLGAAQEFVHAIFEQRSPMITIEAELRVLATLEAIRRSLHEEGTLIPLVSSAAP